MSNIKPSTHGIVVDHKESGVRYAISDRNYNEKVHRKVRDLRPGETVVGYKPRQRESLGDALASQEDPGSPAPTKDATGEQAVVSGDSRTRASKTEGSAPAVSQEKEGK